MYQDPILAELAQELRQDTPRIAVVIPCFRVSRQIMDVIDRIGPECTAIYVIDDACPERSGDLVATNVTDPRVRVVHHEINQGVGGAMITGYGAALADGADVVIKIDGDGQMDPALILQFVAPILEGKADYTKGNRFYNPEDVQTMPVMRLIGNLTLSFMTKLSSGYWLVFDPNNGFVAIDGRVLATIPLHKVARRYFFESDMLFRLNILRAVVCDIPMSSTYANETSSLSPLKVAPDFFRKHMKNFFKRISYGYFLRDFSIASLELVAGVVLLAFGLIFGATTWIANAEAGVVSTTGTVMIAALPLLMGVQFLLAFVGYDIANAPARAVGPLLGKPKR